MASDRTARSVATTVFGFALLLAGGHAVAETGDGATLPTTPVTDEPEGETDLEYEAVVVARREPEDPFLSSRSVSRIGASELSERMPRTMPEALWDAPGAFVQQTNHGGGSPILRGLVGPQVLLLIDGVRLNNSVFRTGPVQYFNLVDPLSIERVEVLRGPGSVLYGSDAMGGVIEAFTPTPLDCSGRRSAFGGRLVGRVGSADVQRTVHGHLEGAVSHFSLLGGMSFKAFDDLTGGRGIGGQAYSGYDHWSAMGRVVARFGEGRPVHGQVTIGYLMARLVDAGRTDQLRAAHSLQFYDNDDHLVYSRLRLGWPRVRTSGQLIVSYQGFLEVQDTIALDEELFSRLSTTRDEVRADTLGLDLHVTSRLIADRLRLRTGATWYRDWVDASRHRRQADGVWAPSAVASYPDGSTYDTFGVFVLLDGSPLHTRSGHEIRLEGGYRFHGMAGYAPENSDFGEVEFTHTGHVFLASVQYLMRDRLNLSASFSQGFRAPNLSEAVMVGDTGKYFHIPNPDLGPERSDTFELLARGRLGRLTIGSAVYLSLIHDLIRREETTWEGLTEVGGKPVAWNVCGGEGLLWGVEGEARLDIGWGLSMAGALTYTWGEERIEGADDVPLSRIPPLFGQVSLRYDVSRARWRAFVETYVRAAGPQDRLSPEDERDARIPEGGTPGWWTWNVRAGVTARERYGLGVSLENLLNEPYKYHGSGVYGAGTSLLVTLDLHL
jgi:outer membrane receptor protein involved in Fe transport